MLSSRGTTSSITASSCFAASAEELVEVGDLTEVARVAVQQEAVRGIRPATSRSRTTALVSSSGTRLPAWMISVTCVPRSLPLAIAARNMSPVEIAGMPNASAMRMPWVPLPEPCGPTIRSRASASGW